MEYDQAMQAIKDLNNDAFIWLQKVPVEGRSRHAFDGRIRSDHITNNMTESFNNWLGNLRSQPILTMLEGIRCKLMGKFQTRYQKAMQWKSNVTLNVKKQLEVTLKWSRTCTVEYAGGNEYEVKDNEGVNHIVHIGAMTCVCRQWEVSGLPCKHAVAAISHSRLNIEEFVHPYYSKATYLRANGGMIHPILHHSMWTLIPGDPL